MDNFTNRTKGQVVVPLEYMSVRREHAQNTIGSTRDGQWSQGTNLNDDSHDCPATCAVIIVCFSVII